MAYATNVDDRNRDAAGESAETGAQKAGDRVAKAFAVNLSARLAAVLGDRLHPHYRTVLVSKLTAAFRKTRHALDIRSRVPTPFGGLYFVFQVGSAPPAGLDDYGPLAARVFAKTPPDAMADLTGLERRMVADCIEGAELSNRHPLDWRIMLPLFFIRIYANFVAGAERRRRTVPIDADRRAEQDDRFAAACLAIAVFGLAGAGVWLLGPTLVDAYLVSAEGVGAAR